jgi:hypothetical protein
MSTLKCIEQKYKSAKISKCEEHGCKLRLDGLGKYLLLKGELLVNNIKMVDCIVFVENNGFLAGNIELKSCDIDAKAIIKKYENSVKKTKEIVEKCGGYLEIKNIYLVLLAKEYRSPSELKILGKGVKIGKIRIDICREKCGAYFKDIIE